MKRMFRRYIKCKLLPFAAHIGLNDLNQYVEFITNAPVWQWRTRLWLVRKTIGAYRVDQLEDLLIFLNE